LGFPGYFGKLGITSENLTYRLGELTMDLTDLLYDQVRCCLRYREGIAGENGEGKANLCAECDAEAAKIVATFFDRIPAVRSILSTDVLAAFEGDPAAQSADETIFCYPGLFSI